MIKKKEEKEKWVEFCGYSRRWKKAFHEWPEVYCSVNEMSLENLPDDVLYEAEDIESIYLRRAKERMGRSYQ